MRSGGLAATSLYGMIYLQGNPLLREPLKPEHIKNRLLGHWGASPALSFVYTHLNRVIKQYDLDMIFMAGPGHGAPGVLAPVYLEGAYPEIYPDKSLDEEGMLAFFRQSSFPGGVGSHCTPETPGSIHEEGNSGRCCPTPAAPHSTTPTLSSPRSSATARRNTGPLATSWHINKFLNPIRDGAVLPILNLNGYKINNPTLLARISHDELEDLFKGYGYSPCFVEGSDPETMHQAFSTTLDHCVQSIRTVQQEGRKTGVPVRPRWPMIILRTPKGWTAPSEYGGHRLEGSLAGPSGADGGRPQEPGAIEIAGGLDAKLQTGGAVRPERFPGPGRSGDSYPRGAAAWGPIPTPTADS